MQKPYGKHFSNLVDDIAALRHRRTIANARIVLRMPRKPADQQAMLKALSDSVKSFSRQKHRPQPTAETRQATATELRTKIDDLIQRAVQAFANKEISAQQLTEIEIRWNQAIAQLQTEGKL